MIRVSGTFSSWPKKDSEPNQSGYDMSFFDRSDHLRMGLVLCHKLRCHCIATVYPGMDKVVCSGSKLRNLIGFPGSWTLKWRQNWCVLNFKNKRTHTWLKCKSINHTHCRMLPLSLLLDLLILIIRSINFGFGTVLELKMDPESSCSRLFGSLVSRWSFHL